MKDLTAEEQADFWKQLGASGGSRAEIKKVVREVLQTRKIESQTASSAGEYRPMGFYKTLGYDVDMIEKNCTKKKFDSVVGWVYKVYVEGDRDDTTDQRVREKEYGKGSNRARSESPAKRGNGAKNDKCGKKGKSRKESAAVKKAKAADAKKNAKAADARKQATYNKKLASRTVTKVAAVTLELQEISKDKFLKFLPEFTRDAFIKTKDGIVSLDKEAKSVMVTGAAYKVNVAHVDEAVAEAKSTIALMRNLLETAKSLRGLQSVKGEPID